MPTQPSLIVYSRFWRAVSLALALLSATHLREDAAKRRSHVRLLAHLQRPGICSSALLGVLPAVHEHKRPRSRS